MSVAVIHSCDDGNTAMEVVVDSAVVAKRRCSIANVQRYSIYQHSEQIGMTNSRTNSSRSQQQTTCSSTTSKGRRRPRVAPSNRGRLDDYDHNHCNTVVDTFHIVHCPIEIQSWLA